MKMLTNVSVRWKIMVPIIVLAVLLILSNIVGFYSAADQMKAGTNISDNYAQSLSHIGDVNKYIESIGKIMYAHCIATSDAAQDALEQEAASVRETIEAVMDEYEKLLNSSEETEAYHKFKESYTEYVNGANEVMRYSHAGDNEHAVELIETQQLQIEEEMEVFLADMSSANQAGMDAAVLVQEQAYHNSLFVSTVFIIIAVVLVILALIVCYGSIVHPLKKVNDELAVVVDSIHQNQGDLTARISVSGRDEIGKIADGINTFIETLQKLMGRITESSHSMDGVVASVFSKVTAVNDNANDISSVMEQLSAAMEEVASTITTVQDNTRGIGDNVKELANASDGLLEYSTTMEKTADEMKKNAVTNKQNTSQIVNNIIDKLQAAIKESKNVERVNELTNEILSISSQTNLLALNASIEAARAGEAGKGFAVVADEISQLADSSRATANNIQSINSMVVASVNELIENSDVMVKYIDENILPDYDGFVSAGKQYSDDAVHINETVEQFNKMAANLRQLMESINESISGIASAVDESANGVTNAAMNTGDLVKDIDQISSEMERNRDVAEELSSEAERFAKL